MPVGDDIRRNVFRDTSNYYLDAPATLFSRGLIEFAVRHCGARILDIGCATGNYMVELSRYGFSCVGVDTNPAYVKVAKERNLDVRLVSESLPFPDRSFDSVILFEVIEHVPRLKELLIEARRVARKNILLTTPNSEGHDELRKAGLIHEHFLDLDHKNFFTPDSLRETLASVFSRFDIRRGDPINPFALVNNGPLRFVTYVLSRLGILKSRFYFRLYAVVDLDAP